MGTKARGDRVSITASAISAVEDALVALLAADTTLAALDGPPHLCAPIVAKLTECWIDDVVESLQEAQLSIDDEERQETFDLFVWCGAVATGDDFLGARDRSAEIADAVVGVVIANQDLGLPNCDIQMAGVSRSSGISADGDRIVLNRVTVRCAVTVI